MSTTETKEVLEAKPGIEPIGRTVEYHLQWRLNSEVWYFSECYSYMTGALLALAQVRKLHRKNAPGYQAEWRLIEQEKITRLVLENV
jgi:hypothetical protein